MMLVCIKQHLSNIWSSIHEKDKQHQGWVDLKKSVAYKKACKANETSKGVIYVNILIIQKICLERKTDKWLPNLNFQMKDMRHSEHKKRTICVKEKPSKLVSPNFIGGKKSRNYFQRENLVIILLYFASCGHTNICRLQAKNMQDFW